MDARAVVITLVVAAVYFGASALGLSMAFVHTSVSPVWPPTGIAIAAVLMLGRSVLPGIFTGAFIANFVTGVGIAASAGIATGNTLEALAASVLVRRYVGPRNPLENALDVFGFVLLAAGVATLVSATIGTTTLCLAGAADWARYGSLWLTWWLGDASGAIVVAPLLLATTTRPVDYAGAGASIFVEALLLLVVEALVALLIFSDWTPAGAGRYPLEFLAVPLLLWAAFRFGQPGVAASSALLSSIAVWGTLNGYGPFARSAPNESLLLLQGFICTSTVTFLVLAAVLSERRRSEADNARLYEESQAAGRIKDEFLATVSHELRTPLHAIFGWVRILQTSPPDDATHDKALEVIERNARAQARLVDDLLDVSRIVAGTLSIDLEPTRLAPIVASAVESARPMAGSKTISIDADLDETADLVLGDASRLQQVVANLLSNAIRYSAAGGRVRVRLLRSGVGIAVEVSDNGDGIDPEFLPFVFDRFRQADSSPTRRHGGLGLGLAIVRHLVELHGGRVDVSSPGLGLGATFRFELPLADSVSDASLEAQPA